MKGSNWKDPVSVVSCSGPASAKSRNWDPGEGPSSKEPVAGFELEDARIGSSSCHCSKTKSEK